MSKDPYESIKIDWSKLTPEILRENQRRRDQRKIWENIFDASENNQVLKGEVERIMTLYLLMRDGDNNDSR